LDFEVLNNILNTFNNFFLKGVDALRGPAASLLVIIAMIDVTIMTLLHLGDPDTLKHFLTKVLKYFMILYVINNFSYLLKILFKGCTDVGIIAASGGMAGQYFHDPALITQEGLRITQPLMTSIGVTAFIPGMNFINTYHLTIGLIIILCFAFIGVQYLVTCLEFNIIGTLSLVLIPFGANKWTSFIAQKATNALVCFAVKIMVLTFIAAAAGAIVSTWGALPGIFDLNKSLAVVIGAMALAFLSWHAPNVAASLMTGQPGLTANHAVSQATGAAMATAGVVSTIATGNPMGLMMATKQGAGAVSNLASNATGPSGGGEGSSGGGVGQATVQASNNISASNMSNRLSSGAVGASGSAASIATAAV
jgi:type IV secretion system protein TrbL